MFHLSVKLTILRIGSKRTAKNAADCLKVHISNAFYDTYLNETNKISCDVLGNENFEISCFLCDINTNNVIENFSICQESEEFSGIRKYIFEVILVVVDDQAFFTFHQHG